MTRLFCGLKGIKLVEGYKMRDQIHILLMTPQKFNVSNMLGFLRGKSKIKIIRKCKNVQRPRFPQ
ncbi:transposase [Microbulbifer epialgicus]|uniref:Transposase n=1 Tax=Microbulbifer epialgicus TaxID=393907 RepID=A0ABV4P7Z1_9GAMM